MKFSKRLSLLNTSIFSKLDEAKQEAIKQGKKVYDFTIGSPNIAPSQAIMDTLVQEASIAKNYMYAIKDSDEFKNSVITYYKERYEVDLNANEVLSLQGSQEGLAHIALAICDQDDYVLIPSPSYPAFKAGAILAGAKIYEMPMLEEYDYLIQFDQIPEEIAMKAKMMIVSYPNNPTGANATDEFFEQLIAFAKKYEIIVIHDNAYSNLVFDGKKGNSFLYYKGAKEVGIEFNSFSKSYGMAGARIGLAVGNEEVIQALKQLKSNIDYGMFMPIQKAAITAFNQDQTIVEETKNTYEYRRNLLVTALNNLGWEVKPCAATMFLWAKIPSNYKSSDEFAYELFQNTAILVTPGSAFGSYGEGYVRIALVQEESVIIEAMEVLASSGFIQKS